LAGGKPMIGLLILYIICVLGVLLFFSGCEESDE
jgi:hypothetical protein